MERRGRLSDYQIANCRLQIIKIARLSRLKDEKIGDGHKKTGPRWYPHGPVKRERMDQGKYSERLNCDVPSEKRKRDTALGMWE